MQIAPAGLDFERRVKFDGCFNFRDLGGYRAGDGSIIRTGRLFRADGPRALSAADVATLDALSLATIVDLRTHTEADEQGRYSDWTSGAFEHHLPMTDILPDPDELMSWSDPRVVATHYGELLTSGHEVICETLAILTDPAAYPMLVHCSAGKDRTGVLSAIILGMLGVPDETIIDDYAISAPAMINLVDHLHRSYPDAKERIDRVAPAMTAADPATMQWFIANIRAEHQSFAGYIESLGMQSAVPYARSCLLNL